MRPPWRYNVDEKPITGLAELTMCDFKDDGLFFVFYTFTGDRRQLYAAVEL